MNYSCCFLFLLMLAAMLHESCCLICRGKTSSVWRMSSTPDGAQDMTIASDSYSAEIDMAKEKVLTLKAYIDEAERELFRKDWDNLFIFLNIITEQDEEFAILIDGLFPSQDPLDSAAREAMSFEAQAMYLALDCLKDATKDEDFQQAQNSYAKMLLSYDRFLKAGDLYPTYDPITSTEIFFADTPRDTLNFDTKSKIHTLDHVILNSGPDMGKTGVAIYFDQDKAKAVVKLDKNGRVYQEVKVVKLAMLSKINAPRAVYSQVRSNSSK